MVSKFTLVDGVVRDSLASVGRYGEVSKHYKPAITGGIALQLYANQNFPDLLRPTHDLDLLVIPRLSADTFRTDVGRNLAKLLEQYKPEIGVSRHVYEVKITDNQGDPFFIHAYRWTVNGWKRRGKSNERQLSNANKLPVSDGREEAYVVRLEDIVAQKVSRLRKKQSEILPNLSEIYKLVEKRNWSSLSEQDLFTWLSSLIDEKKRLPAFYDRGIDEFMKALSQYAVSKDLYDIALISKIAPMGGFDEKYYDDIIREEE